MAKAEKQPEAVEIDLSLAPDPLPKAGDEVNYVHPHSKKIIKVQVAHVPQEHKGRTVMVEVPGKKKNADGEEVETLEKVSAPFRPKEKLAGNTWHHALIAALLLLAFSVCAGIPTYHTLTGVGNGTTPAAVIFPADPNLQVRVVTVNYTADTNTAVLNMSSGTTAYSLLMTNPTTAWTTNVINTTNGLAAGALMFLQSGGIVYTNTISTVGNSGTSGFTNNTPVINSSGAAVTNVSYIIMATGGWGVLPIVNSEVYLQGPISTVWLGSNTNWLNGDDIFSGNYGRPVMLQIAGVIPASATNRLNSVGAHYDSASQP